MLKTSPQVSSLWFYGLIFGRKWTIYNMKSDMFVSLSVQIKVSSFCFQDV